MAECNVHKLVADVTLLAENSVLMVKYRDTAKYDEQSGWFLPDDYISHLERPEDAAKRILQEQAGLDAVGVTLDHLESFSNGAWHLVFHFKAELGSRPEVKAGDNIAEIRGSLLIPFRRNRRLPITAGVWMWSPKSGGKAGKQLGSMAGA